MSLPCLALLLTSFPAAEPAGYTRPQLLMEAVDLKKPATAKKFVVLDARGRGNYLAGHIPGAVWIDHVTWERTFHKDRAAKGWAKRIGALGIKADTPVVLYDANKSKDAARMWWILRYWGVKDVRLLNGGWTAWERAKGKVEKDENKPRAVEPKLSAQAERLATKDQLLKWLKSGRMQVLDARSTGEYCGSANTAKRNGTIPGSKHLEWSDTLDRSGRFKSAAQLRKLFEGAGIDVKKPATTFCQSGGRASVLAFVVELMGGEEVRNYYQSWKEWGNDKDTPVVKPKPRGKK